MVRIDSQDVPVERRVMEFAEGEAVWDCGLTPRMSVRQDVGGLQQLIVPQATNCTLLTVGPQDTLPERFLMQATLCKAGDVLAPGLRYVKWLWVD